MSLGCGFNDVTMGFNIKNNFGPNIEVNDGGRVTLVQGRNGLWHTTDAEDAEIVEENHTDTVGEGEGEVGGKDTFEGEPVFIDLKFFTSKAFNSMERQAALRKLLKESVQKINVDAGRDWVAIYIAYHYYTNARALMKKYADFFADIEALLPYVLTKVNKDEQGDKRYKKYTESLSTECDKWFVDDSCLPPMNEWISKKYRYWVDDDRKKKMQGIANEVYKGLGEIQ